MRRLNLVAAPAGYGKTTLVSEWIKQLDIPSAWITFDETDNNPHRFLQYLIVSLQKIEPGIGITLLASLQSPQFSGSALRISDAIASLVNEVAPISHPLILVFDDYHVIESLEIHGAVMFLLDHLPEKLSLVISTRSDPPLSLARLRARRQLLEIRSDSLRFSEGEAGAFLRQVMHLDINDEEVALLADRTEGWVAGLQMAALALQERTDTAKFIREFSGRERFVIDYLFEEVLNRQPDHLQNFLIQTSILERMTGSLCDAVLGSQEPGDSSPLSVPPPSSPESGQRILERLERSNLFLVSLDNQRHYFRYHHLFSDLLRHRLRRDYPDLIPSLHSRAAEWFETQGSASKALDHWMAANNYGKAASLIAKNGYKFLEQGNFQQMLIWLQQIPKDVVHSQPWLCIFYSWALVFMGRFSEGEEYLSFAEKILSPISEAADPVLREQFGHVATVREYLASRSQDVAGITRYADLALKYLPSDDLSIRSIITFFLGHARLLSDQIALAHEAYTDSAKLGKEAGNTLITVNALCALANLIRSQGELHRAFDVYQQAAKLVIDDRGISLPVAAEVYVGRARLYYEWDDLKTAEEDLLAAHEIFKLYPNFDLMVDSNIALSRLRLAQGDLGAAEQLLQEVEPSDKQTSLRPGVELLAYQMNLYRVMGNWAKVCQITEGTDWSLEDKCLFAWSEAFIAYAKFLISQNRCSDAHDLLDRCLSKAQASGLWLYVIKVLVTQASLLDSQGRQSSAEAKMEQALSLAEPEGFIRLFVDEGEQARSLITKCRLHIAQKTGVDGVSSFRLLAYIDKLLEAFRPSSRKPTETLISVVQSPELIVPLTNRELEVLQLIASGFSNKEIAEKLVVSVGTIKAHTSSLYRKLDVQGRTKAIAKAREIHIL